MSATSVLIQDEVYDHGDLTFKLDGTEEVNIKELKYSAKREVGKFRGTSPMARGRGRGTIDFEASIVILKSAFDRLVEIWGDGWMERVFNAGGVYGQDGQKLSTVLLSECTIISHEEGTSEGSDVAVVSLGLDVMGIKINGKVPMKGMKF